MQYSGKAAVGAASVPPSPEDTTFRTYKNRMPHWRSVGSTYFVTWRLAAQQHDLSPPERDTVQQAILHFGGQRYDLLAHVVMTDHVHVLLEPTAEYKLETIVHTWKSFSAHQLQRLHGRDSNVWQKDYFNRIIRDERELRETVRYILLNPSKRWPGTVGYRWLGLGGTEAAPTVDCLEP
jgi:REP element-mobilizing transposase RayT